MRKLPITLLASAFFASVSSAQLKPTPLTGTWSLTEVKTTGPNSRAISNATGLLIFTGNHYSRMYIASDQPREAIEDQAKATAAELLAVWGPFVAASGTYEISGSTLNLRPIVAKNPQVMEPGVVDAFSFKLEGNTLILGGVKNSDGGVRNPGTFMYTRIE
jgi:Lipocalin-like domain